MTNKKTLEMITKQVYNTCLGIEQDIETYANSLDWIRGGVIGYIINKERNTSGLFRADMWGRGSGIYQYLEQENINILTGSRLRNLYGSASKYTPFKLKELKQLTEDWIKTLPTIKTENDTECGDFHFFYRSLKKDTAEKVLNNYATELRACYKEIFSKNKEVKKKDDKHKTKP